MVKVSHIINANFDNLGYLLFLLMGNKHLKNRLFIKAVFHDQISPFRTLYENHNDAGKYPCVCINLQVSFTYAHNRILHLEAFCGLHQFLSSHRRRIRSNPIYDRSPLLFGHPADFLVEIVVVIDIRIVNKIMRCLLL